MADVFISYSRDDQALVRKLAEAVRREGYSVWWDDELPPHRSYGDVITDEIGAAKAAIVVWSKSAAASQWVRAEADVARNQKKLIQVSIDDRMPPLPFNQLHFVSIGDWQGEAEHPGWRKVRESLAALCGAGAGPPAFPMPATPPPAAPARHKWHVLLIGVIALSLLVIAGVGAFAWLGGAPRQEAVKPAPQAKVRPGPPIAQPDKPEAAPPPSREAALPAAPPAPAPKQVAPMTSTPAAPTQRAPAGMRAARRYCLGRGRDTPQCRRLRAQQGN